MSEAETELRGKSPPGRGPHLPLGLRVDSHPHPVQGGLCCLELAREAG